MDPLRVVFLDEARDTHQEIRRRRLRDLGGAQMRQLRPKCSRQWRGRCSRDDAEKFFACDQHHDPIVDRACTLQAPSRSTTRNRPSSFASTRLSRPTRLNEAMTFTPFSVVWTTRV